MFCVCVHARMRVHVCVHAGFHSPQKPQDSVESAAVEIGSLEWL